MINNKLQLAQHILSIIDLTSLNQDDTEETIRQLCNQAVTDFGHVAAVCIYPKFIKLAKTALQKQSVLIATVSNFPSGNSSLQQVQKEIEQSLADGADEIDVVFPYALYLAGDRPACIHFIRTCKQLCGSKTLKVILETGALKDPLIIADASADTIHAGADFLKTSTGKITVNATLEAAQIMLTAIKKYNPKVGFKASGGIRTLDQAVVYLNAAKEIMGNEWPNANHFRIGASSLLQDVLACLSTIKTI